MASLPAALASPHPRRALALVLAVLLLLIQYPLWLGKGGWLRVWELDRQHQAQLQGNQRLVERNTALESEVRDLRQGMQAVEERARYELGMVRPDEVFVQFNEVGGASGSPASPAGPARRADPDRVKTAAAR
ncbi:MAG: cell division protein FtsB [Betaproteobacteria bacterium]|nr:cell division protein FtsB [Betaproteobacteria bacterium]